MNGPSFSNSSDSKLLKSLKSVVAGGLAGGLEVLLTYPTEYIKTQLQLDERSKNRRFNGIFHCGKLTVRENGFFGLYRGLSTLLYASIPKSAIRFTSYEQLKLLLSDESGNISQKNNAFAGLLAGFSEAILIVCPMETIKVRIINDSLSSQQKYKGSFQAAKTIMAEEGFFAIYKGLTATLLKQGTNQAVRFWTYSNMKKYLQTQSQNSDIGFVGTFSCGLVAGTASVYANTPIDVIKTRMQGLDAHKYKNTFDCAMKIFQNEGSKAFYKGALARLSRVAFDCAFQFTIYEQVMKFLNRFG